MNTATDSTGRPFPTTAPHILPTRPIPTPHLLDLARAASAFAAAAQRGVSRLGERLHAAEDDAASAEGWQISRARWGGRTYRHPGFERKAQ
jgi:hypothetical protein